MSVERGFSGGEVARVLQAERAKLTEQAALAAGTTVLAEWDWVYTCTSGGRRLHHLAKADDPERLRNEAQSEGVATCGLRTRFSIPGIFSRMGMLRCARCCDKLGLPLGEGSPKNDDVLRPWVKFRLEEMRKAFTEEEL